MHGQEDERIVKQTHKQEKLEKRLHKIRNEIVETYKRRRESEKDFLEVIKKQMEYWKDRLSETDPEKNKKRYNELKQKIKGEETLIKQIKEELGRIDQELKQEREHEEKEKRDSPP